VAAANAAKSWSGERRMATNVRWSQARTQFAGEVQGELAKPPPASN
jgi:hypothetical protein